MLNKYDNENIENIKRTVITVWGDNCVLGMFKQIDAPFTIFEWDMVLYGKFDVRLEYERGTLGTMVKTDEGYVGLSRLTDEEVVRGLKSCVPENMLRNFQILDRLLEVWMQ